MISIKLREKIQASSQSLSRKTRVPLSPLGLQSLLMEHAQKHTGVNNDLFYRRWENMAGDGITLQLVLPKPLQKQAFEQLHEAPTAGHLGINIKLLAESSRDFTGATTLKTSEDGALAVTCVHPEKGHNINLEHQWGSTMLACLWSVLLLTFLAHSHSQKVKISTC